MPGLIDCHNHFLSTALGWNRVQLADATSIGELLEAIGQRVQETPLGQWVLCASRWYETSLAEHAGQPPRSWTAWHPTIRSICHAVGMWW